MEQNYESDKTYAPSTNAKPPVNQQDIPGWGIDMPQERRVGIPREDELSPYDNGAHWSEPEQQRRNVKVFYSVERPTITRVFGTTCPPKGLSGLIRGYAYSLGESKRRRWLSLILADRVDVVENTVTEFVFGPQHYKNRPKKVRQEAIIAGTVGLITLVGLLAFSRRSKSRKNVESKIQPDSLVFANRGLNREDEESSANLAEQPDNLHDTGLSADRPEPGWGSRI